MTPVHADMLKKHGSPKKFPFTVEQLRSILKYDPDTGVFTWLMNPTKRIKAGSVAGTVYNTGYHVIGYQGRAYLAHRLAWFHFFGVFPQSLIDHKNHIKTDNRIDNLREATPAQNLWNAQIRPNNTSGFVGVSWSPAANSWRAQCKQPERGAYVGIFRTPEEASDAYQAVAKQHRGEFVPSINNDKS